MRAGIPRSAAAAFRAKDARRSNCEASRAHQQRRADAAAHDPGAQTFQMKTARGDLDLIAGIVFVHLFVSEIRKPDALQRRRDEHHCLRWSTARVRAREAHLANVVAVQTELRREKRYRRAGAL